MIDKRLQNAKMKVMEDMDMFSDIVNNVNDSAEFYRDLVIRGARMIGLQGTDDEVIDKYEDFVIAGESVRNGK